MTKNRFLHCVSLTALLFSYSSSLFASQIGDQYVNEWHKQLKARAWNINSFDATEAQGKVLILGHYYGNIGILASMFDSSGSVIHESTLLAPDTSAIVLNAMVPKVMGPNLIRLYGSECNFRSVPPFHLSKQMSEFRPMFIDFDSSLSATAPSFFGPVENRFYTPFAFNGRGLDSVVAVVSSREDTMKVAVYDESLKTRFVNATIVLDSGRVFGYSPVYKLAHDVYCFGTFVTVDMGGAYYYVYTLRNRGQKVERISLSTQISTQMVLLGKDTIVSGSVHFNDSTYELILNFYSMQGTLLSSHKVLPSITIEPACIAPCRDGGLIVAGSCRKAHDLSGPEANRRGFVCKLNRNFDVTWYDILADDTVAQQFTQVLETKDSSIWAIGWSGSSTNPTMLVSKYAINNNVSTTIEPVESFDDLKASPQPAVQYVKLSGTHIDGEYALVTVQNMAGEIVLQSTQLPICSNSIEIPLEKMVTGSYVTTIETSKCKLRKLINVSR